MIISVEISYYPLSEDYNKPISDFIDLISKNKDLEINIGKMSTIITGEYKLVMDILNNGMQSLMEKYPSVFTLKVSNTCPI